MDNADFVMVGSSGGGGTISWLLAKAGFNVVVLEQGSDFGRPLEQTLANPLDQSGNLDAANALQLTVNAAARVGLGNRRCSKMKKVGR
jgi:choline dehydrogenase-like flavoprotein